MATAPGLMSMEEYLRTSYRPDVNYIHGEIEERSLGEFEHARLQHADAPREKITSTPPLLCIEIMSPEDRLSRAKFVLADYLAMGVAHNWLIDPLRRAAFTFDAAGPHEVDPPQLKISGTSIHLDLANLFAALD
jgi:Uma2 family endonuclease